MNASDVMVREVVTARPEDDVATAVRSLVDHDVSALPVVDEDRRVVGVLSEGDLIRRVEDGARKRRPWWVEALTPATSLAADFARSHGRLVREVMSTEVISVKEDASLADVATLLEKKRIKRVPVLRDGRLVGVVSRSNLIQALASLELAKPAAVSPDRGVREAVLQQLAEQPWTGFGERNITVKDGVVHVWGLVGSPEEHKALLALVEGVAGVKAVSDETIAAY